MKTDGKGNVDEKLSRRVTVLLSGSNPISSLYNI
jgi:hypothetical protein